MNRITDFAAHNQEVKAVWSAFHTGKPTRVPIVYGTNTRYTMFMEEANPKGITFKEYSEDPDVMFLRQLEHADWLRHNVPQDAEMGLPEEGWSIGVDLQNYFEAGWFGSPIQYYDDQVPDAAPFLDDDHKRMLFDSGLPDPFRHNLMKRNISFWEHFKARAKGYAYKGLPVTKITPSGMGTDGPFTVAACIRGAADLCADIYMDPKYVHELLGFITEATILRINAYRGLMGEPERPQELGFADDSVQLLSVETYSEFVLPYHRRLVGALSLGGPNSIHLCGDATHLFKTIQAELNVQSFDTGFPVDFGRLRQELGEGAQINGGPHVALLKKGPPEAIEAEVKRILGSGVTQGGKFVLREGNNVSPGTPLEHLYTMYEAGKRYGGYEG